MGRGSAMGNSKRNGRYSYADYLTWPEGERWELIDGVAYDMSPAPSRKHQGVLGKLFRKIADVADRLGCETYVAPFDVRFPESPEQAEQDEEVFTVVQPDIVVYCDEDLLDDRGAHGAPALAVEILSPSTGFKDQSEKLLLYERSGVREYWVVNPHAKFVMVYSQGEIGGFAKPEYFKIDEEIRSAVLGGAVFALKDFLG